MVSDESSLSKSERGVSNVLGYSLLLVLIFGSIAVIVTVGAAGLNQTQQHSELERAEHSMTLLDSRAAMVALGTSSTQSLQFAHDTGSYEVRPDAGWLAIKHLNYSAGETETIYNKSLGAFVYQNGDTEIAYQGGGVWRFDTRGAARMLSPPEFHYRRATLTLPVIQTTGSVSSGSSPIATVRNQVDARQVFPNSTTLTPDGPGAPYNSTVEPYTNPIDSGTVEVQIRSKYYEGWASYFRERTTGEVEVFDNNNTVHLTLLTLEGSIGPFPMPPENQGINVNGMGDEHPVTQFELNLSEGQTGQGNSENHWAMYSSDGYNQFEIHIAPNFDDCRATVSIFYRNKSTNEHEEWEVRDLTDSSPVVECTGSKMNVDLTSSENITYTEIKDAAGGSGTKFCFGETINNHNIDSNMKLKLHENDDPGPNVTFNNGDTMSLEFTINHYLSRLGMDYSLTVKDAQGNFCPSGSGPADKGNGSSSVHEDSSDGVLRFEEAAAARFITFLHITENRIHVNLN